MKYNNKQKNANLRKISSTLNIISSFRRKYCPSAGKILHMHQVALLIIHIDAFSRANITPTPNTKESGIS